MPQRSNCNPTLKSPILKKIIRVNFLKFYGALRDKKLSEMLDI